MSTSCAFFFTFMVIQIPRCLLEHMTGEAFSFFKREQSTTWGVTELRSQSTGPVAAGHPTVSHTAPFPTSPVLPAVCTVGCLLVYYRPGAWNLSPLTLVILISNGKAIS